MKKILLVLLTLLILIPFSFAQTEILDADAATVRISITNTVNLITGINGYINEGKATLDWYPRETYNQEVLELITKPEAKIINNNYVYSWNNPINQIGFSIEAILNTNTDVVPVQKKVEFPIIDLPRNLEEYTRPSNMIDTNNDIKDLASNLASGEDDLYKVVFNIADWVTTNIEYNLTTVTADAVYPSSWVLDKGYGVCDEMTNLFISLNRALGIPARFVSGVSYTNIPSVEDWGGHGWAEVYFPETGWVPFDVTYGEYGYIDAGHIKLNDGIDSGENSVEFSGNGKDFEILTKPLDINVDIIKEHERAFDIVSAKLTPYADEVSFGSYNLLILELKNLRNYYVSTRVDLGFTTGSTHESPDKINILLTPREKKEIYFLVKINEGLDKDFSYNFPIAAYTKLASPAETSFNAKYYAPKLTKVMFKEYFDEEPKKIANIKIDCDNKEYYKPGEISFKCEFLNQETRDLDAEICFDNCEDIYLERNIPKSYEVNINKTVGVYTLPIIIREKSISKTSFITISVINDTKPQIEVLDYPDTITFQETGTISFIITTNNVKPRKVQSKIIHKYFEQEWDEAPLENQRYMFSFKGYQLNPDENKLTISVDYDDVFGDSHNIEKTLYIDLVDLSFGEKIIVYMNVFGFWIEDTFNKIV